MIRLILTLTALILFLVGSIPLMIFEWILGFFNKPLKDISSLRIVQWGFRRVIDAAGTKIIVRGEENLPEGAALYVGNHSSYFDVVISYMLMKNLTGYISKKEMLKVPLLNIWMKNLHCIFMDRHDIKDGLKAILAAIEKAKQGISICIFPEGTRAENPDVFGEFKDASFKIASKADIPVVPMALVNTRNVWEAHFPRIEKQTVVLEYLPPINIKELSKDEQKHIGAYVSGRIKEVYDRNKKEYFG